MTRPGRLRYVLHLWFGFSIPVSRAAYLTTGCALMGGKYAVEALVVYLVTGQVWTPADYLIPSVERYTRLGSGSPLAWGLAVWSLPFIWIGASMTARRALDAGLSAVWGLLFFVPLVNDLVMLALATLPCAPAPLSRRTIAGSEGRAACAARPWGCCSALPSPQE